jgi:hypothetical protein
MCPFWAFYLAAWSGWGAWLWRTRATSGCRFAHRPVLRPLLGEARYAALARSCRGDKDARPSP